jgi:predicted nucleotidyltransferase/biotin operon repressor
MVKMLIERIFQGKYRIQIVKSIISTPDGCSITEISKELKISKSVVFKNISKLKDENILISFTKGKRKLYKLNEDNYFVKTLAKRMLELEDQIMDDVKDLIIDKFKRIEILSLVLYGSFLTPNFDFKSDIDLIAIVKSKRRVKEEIEKVTKYFYDNGLTLFVDVIEMSEFKKLHKIKEPLIINIIQNGVVLYGKHPIELI